MNDSDLAQALAQRIVAAIRPGRVLDAHGGSGQLVEALRRAGADAIGRARSPEAPRDDQQGVPSDPSAETYDLALWLGEARDMDSAQADRLAEQLCRLGDDILFSPVPPAEGETAGWSEPLAEAWTERFARHGFFRDLQFDASLAGPRAARFRRAADPALAVAAYEGQVQVLEQESAGLRLLLTEQRLDLTDKQQAVLDSKAQARASQARSADLEGRLAASQEHSAALEARIAGLEASLAADDRRWRALESSAGWAVLRRLQRLRARLAPPGSRRDHLLDMVFHTLRSRQPAAYARLAGSVGRAAARQGRRLLGRLPFLPGAPPTGREVQVDPVESRPELREAPRRAAADIVVCVHNALADVQRCLASVVSHTTPPYGLILVNDGSDRPTGEWLESFAQAHGALLLTNEQAVGYTRAANQGWDRSSADYVTLLNSDTVVTPLWLDRMIACAEADPRTGIVGPLSNTASWQSVPDVEAHGDWAANPLPEGMTVDDMGQLVGRYSSRLYPSMPFLNGFCLLIRRALVDQVGRFDEEGFGAGYGEEDDYALRARSAGWRLALADDAYVYHAQSKSYTGEARHQLSERAGKTLARKHGLRAVEQGVEFCLNDPVLAGIRSRARAMLAREAWIREGQARYAGRRVLFVLPIAMAGGGGNVVVDEARAMRLMGVDARLFNLAAYRGRFERAYPLLDIPVAYGEVEDLAALALGQDAVVATYNPCVEWLAGLAPRAGRPARGYYIQGFEPYMYQEGSADYDRALQSYDLFPGLVRFAKTEWTRQEVLRQTGADSAVVGASINIDLFRPRPRAHTAPLGQHERRNAGRLPPPERPAGDEPLRLAAMIRPESPYRQPELTMSLLKRAAETYGEAVEIVLFGTTADDPGFAALPHSFPWRLAGLLSQRQVARLLTWVDIFVDWSSHQAMGLTALEAMACGAAVIVPEHGGATAFAHHGHNSLVVDTSSADACWQALRRLVEDGSLRATLQRKALVDVCDLYPERPAFHILTTLFGDRQAAPWPLIDSGPQPLHGDL